jgi:hypothetical protein
MPNCPRALRSAGVLLVLLVLTGCMNSADDPNSAQFAARCSGAFNLYYVDGGKGPEYKANSKKYFYWRDRYYRVAGINDEAAKTLIKTSRTMMEAHRGESTETRKKVYKQIQDACNPHQV